MHTGPVQIRFNPPALETQRHSYYISVCCQTSARFVYHRLANKRHLVSLVLQQRISAPLCEGWRAVTKSTCVSCTEAIFFCYHFVGNAYGHITFTIQKKCGQLHPKLPNVFDRITTHLGGCFTRTFSTVHF